MLAGALPAMAMLAAVQTVEAPPEFAVLVVDFRGDAQFAGLPKVCPGSDPADAQEDEVCIAELYDAPVRIVRRIAGTPKVTGRSLRFTAHAIRVSSGSRMLVMAYRWKRDWLFAPWWELPDKRGEVCLEKVSAERLRIEPEWSRWRLRTIVGEGNGIPYPLRCLRL